MFLKFITVCALLGIIEAEVVWLNRRLDVDTKLDLVRKEFVIDSYIVGGNEAKPHSHPYQAALLVEANDVFFCGGSLISPNFVLTAANCVNRAKFISVVLGAHDLKVEEPSQILVEGTYFIRHHSWDEKKNLNNIAVIKLSKTVVPSPEIQLVKLPPLPSVEEPENTVLSGWGKTSDSASDMSYKLQEVKLDVMSNSVCEQIIDDITPSHMCTSGENKKGACKGDIGAPLVSDRTQYGIVSSVNSICQNNMPTVYTRVDKFLNWIRTNTDVSENVY